MYGPIPGSSRNSLALAMVYRKPALTFALLVLKLTLASKTSDLEFFTDCLAIAFVFECYNVTA